MASVVSRRGRLQDRTVIVTGGGHGIGAAYVRRVVEEGANAVIAELDGASAEILAKKLREEGYSALAIPTDVTDETSVATMVRTAVDEFGGVDVLVNNAAIYSTIPMSRGTFDEIDRTEWDRMLSVNVIGTWICSKAVFGPMRDQGYGKIITISSGTALKGVQGLIHYVTSKAAILGFTKTLARELGKYNITVNCIAPGNTLSEENPDEATIALRTSAATDRPLSRVQTPQDLLGALVFFASPDSDFITGQTLVVDGGAHMH
jgi:3-oxoacyl-[acyl-carrier protein] reductase